MMVPLIPLIPLTPLLDRGLYMVDMNINLTDLLTGELGPPTVRNGGGLAACWWSCPFHPDSNPSLKITPDEKHFKCHGCGEAGDAIDFVRQLHGLTFQEALGRLKGSSFPSRNRDSRGSRGSRGSRKPVGPLLSPLKADPPAEWQQGARHIATVAKQCLWHRAAGKPGLVHLRERGLADETIRKYRLGWCDLGHYKAEWRAYLTEGIVIPWEYRRTIRVIRFRHWRSGEYRFLKGSRDGMFYPSNSFLPGKPVLIAEGELDALLALQEASDLVQVGTLGSASARLTAEALAALVCIPLVVLAYDADAAGDKAADYWRRLLPRKARRARPPDGMDLTDIHKSRRGLRKWIEQELRRTRK